MSFAGAVNPADGSQYALCWKYRRAFIEDRLCHRLQLAHGLLPIVITGGATLEVLLHPRSRQLSPAIPWRQDWHTHEAVAASRGRHSHECIASGHKTVQVIAG